AAVPGGAGHRLTGMRERGVMYRGSVAAGPRPGGGFEGGAPLPLTPAQADAAGASGSSPSPPRHLGGPGSASALARSRAGPGREGWRAGSGVAAAVDGPGARRVLSAVTADVVVMGVRMPRLDGIEATRRICQAGDRPRVLMLTTFDLDEYAYAALKAGASGFLL